MDFLQFIARLIGAQIGRHRRVLEGAGGRTFVVRIAGAEGKRRATKGYARQHGERLGGDIGKLRFEGEQAEQVAYADFFHAKGKAADVRAEKRLPHIAETKGARGTLERISFLLAGRADAQRQRRNRQRTLMPEHHAQAHAFAAGNARFLHFAAHRERANHPANSEIRRRDHNCKRQKKQPEKRVARRQRRYEQHRRAA